MKNLIEIKIECKGDAVGTLGWFNSIIEKSELVIKNSKKGSPAMFLKTPQKNGEMGHEFICEKWNVSESPDGYKLVNDFICIVPEGDYYMQGFSDYPLTPACKIKVQEFLDSALEKYQEWWNNDK
jgi:hypothetical protein